MYHPSPKRNLNVHKSRLCDSSRSATVLRGVDTVRHWCSRRSRNIRASFVLMMMSRFTIDDVGLHRRTAFSFTATDPSNDAVLVDFRALPARLLAPTTPPTKTGDAEGVEYDESVVVDVDHLFLRATSASP